MAFRKVLSSRSESLHGFTFVMIILFSSQPTSRGEQIKQKKVKDGEELAGAHPEHVEANDEPIDDDFSMYLPSTVPNSGGKFL